MSEEWGQIVRTRSRRPSVKFFLLLWLILSLVGECLWYFVGPPRRYTAEAKFERRSDAATANEPGYMKADAEARKLTLEYELVGLAAMTQAAEDEGLTKGLPHGPDGQLTAEGAMARQELVNALVAGTRVRWDARSEPVDLVAVTFTHDDPDVAARIPNTLVRNYIYRTGETIKRNLEDSRDFLRKQIAECVVRLDAQVRNRQEFEVQYQDVRPQDPNFLPQQIQQVERDLDRAASQKTMAETKLALLDVMLPKITSAPATTQPYVAAPNPKLAQMKEELQSCKDDRDSAVKVQRMNPQHPSVVALDQKIAMLEERITGAETQPTTRPPYVDRGPGLPDDLAIQVQPARLEFELADRELTRLRVRRAELDGLQGRLGVARREYAKLVEKEKEIEKEKDSWQRRESDVQMTLAAELANRRTHLSCVQAAQRPTQPDEILPPWAVMGWSLGGGLTLSGLVALLIWPLRRARLTAVACLILLTAAIAYGILASGIRPDRVSGSPILDELPLASADRGSSNSDSLTRVQTAQEPTPSDADLLQWTAVGWFLGCGFVLGGLVVLLIWAFRTSPLTAVACLVLLALILSLVVLGPAIREGGFLWGGKVQSGWF